jgi:hypothetical protein
MRGCVSSLFCLFVSVTSVIVLAVGTHWIATRQMGQLDGILLLMSYMLAGLVFAYRFLFADFEPLSITRAGARL